ncbi:MAG: hypothetical protein ABJG41_01295 [Cyclobacteriaceae bacterium]
MNCELDKLTTSQRRLFEAIKKHETKTGRFCGAPKPSHMGMSQLKGYDTGITICTGFQKRTFWELVDRKIITQTMFCGYRLSDSYHTSNQ